MTGIMQQLAKSSPMMTQIKQMMNMVQTAQNPQAVINQLMMSNPNMKQVMQIVQQYGGDANKAFYSMVEQQGINPQEIFDMMK